MKLFVIIVFSIVVLSSSLFSKDAWERVNAPNDTPTLELAIDSSGNLYTCYFGMYKSTNDGLSWQVIDELSAQGVTVKLSQTSIIMSSIDVAKNGYLFSSMRDGGVFRSKDGGLSWDFLSDSLQNIHSFISCNNGRLFCNSTNDLYYSDDYGDSWTRFSGWPDVDWTSFTKKRMALSPSGKLFASNKGVWVIDTGSLAYNYYTDGIDSSFVRCFAFGNGKVFAGTDTGGVYFSTNDGQSWTNLPNSPKSVSISSMVYTNTGKIIAGSDDGGLFYSTDDGSSWTESTPFSDYKINDIDIYKDKIYVSSNGIFTSTDDGIRWEKLPSNPGYPIVYYYNMNNAGKIFAFTDLGLYSSSDNGNSWDLNPLKEINRDELTGILLNKDDKLFIWSYWEEYFKYSDNDGETWNNVPGFEETHTYTLKENSIGYLYLINDYSEDIYISKNNGSSWEKIVSNSGVYYLGIGTKDELIYTDALTVYYSTDYGYNWIPKTCNQLNGRFGRENLEKDGDFIWISHSQDGILMSSDLGNTWREINGGLRDPKYVGEFQVNYMNKIANTLYTGLAYGLFSYDFDNNNWILSDSGITPSAIVRVDHLKDKHVYALTTTGVYRTVDSVVSVEEQVSTVEDNSIAAYPNPFSDKIILNIKGNNKSESIIISDNLGRIILTTQTEFLELGRNHKITLHTENFASGVYYVRIPGSTTAKVIVKTE
ncbi:MAG: T9SS type A sorting domain-containing protein [Bacteroidetes bacterium]|nr:MAG: T9SS type A sorting domain-containing protein [Bacteroidota bacterium]